MKVLRQDGDSARLGRAAAADYGTGAIIAAARGAAAAERCKARASRASDYLASVLINSPKPCHRVPVKRASWPCSIG
jgi:hypothetical protein